MQRSSVNPYSPPREAPSTSEQPPSRLRRILLEIVQALATIIGIMIGWGFIGAGQLNGSYFNVPIGILIIVAACAIGLSIRPAKPRRLADDDRSMAVSDADVR